MCVIKVSLLQKYWFLQEIKVKIFFAFGASVHDKWKICWIALKIFDVSFVLV